MRGYDTRIGRFWSVDPLTQKYPWCTPYQFGGNTPIQAIDRGGLEEWKVNDGKGTVIGPYANQQEAQKAVDAGTATPQAPGPPPPVVKQAVPQKKSEAAEWINAAHTLWRIVTADPSQPIAAQPEATTPLGQVAEMAAPYIPYDKIGGILFTKLVPKAAGPVIKSVGEYLGLMKPVDEYDVAKTLYRGTTGKEVGATVLFLTDDATVAATYVKNGGQVVRYEMSQFSLNSLKLSGEIELKTGINGANGIPSTEYMFKGKTLVEAVNSLANPIGK